MFSVLDSYCATDTDVKITLIDKETNQPIKGIQVNTANTRALLSGTSDTNGVAIILPKTDNITYAGTRPEYNICRAFINQYNSKTKQGVKLCTNDTEGIYSRACITISNNTGCNIKILLSKKTSKKTYPTPQEMSQLALTRGGKLQFYPVCDETYTDYPSKITVDKRHCVNDFFKNTGVQMLAAEELAKLYALEKHNSLIECNIAYETRNGDDFLQCTGINNLTSEADAYEFRFRNLNADKGKKLEHGIYKVQHSAANALCRLPGGTYKEDESSCTKNDAELDRKMCTKLDRYANKFGWNARYGSRLANENSYSLLWDTCLFDFNIKKSEDYELRKYGDIDPYVFQHMTVQSNRDLTLLLNQYIRFKTLDKFKELECDTGFTRYTQDTRFDNTTDLGQIVTCHLTTVDDTIHDLNFLFKSVNESNTLSATDSKAGMSCIASGGNFDGKHCSSVGQIQCYALASELPGGAVWDNTLGICKMADSYNAKNIDNIEHKIKLGSSVVVGIVITAATAGAASTPVLVWVATVAGSAASAELEFLQDIKDERARDFVAASQLCPYTYSCSRNDCEYKCNPESNCAKNILLNAYRDIPDMLHTNENTSNSSQLSQAVTFAHDTILEKLSESCIDEEFAHQLLTTTSELNDKIAFYSLVGVVAGAAGVAADIKDMVSASKNLGTIGRIANSSKRTSNVFIKSAKAEKTMQKILNYGDTLYNAGSTVEMGN